MLRLLIRYSGDRRKLRRSWLPFYYWRLVLSGPPALRIHRRAPKSIMGCPNGWDAKWLPTPSVPWSAPIFAATRACSISRAFTHRPAETLRLVELIDIAERVNPETRVAWEAARQAAIGVGLVESEYFPVLTLSALGGYQSEAFPRPRMSLPAVSFVRP